MRMSLRYSFQSIEEQENARPDVESVLIAVSVDGFAINVLQDEKRLARSGHSRIDEFRDVWMCETAQNSTFAFESLGAASPHQGDIQHFYRDAPLKPTVVSLGEPNGAHSAMANLRDQGIDAKNLPSQALPSRKLRRFLLKKSFFIERTVLIEQPLQLRGNSRILIAQRSEPGGALVVRQLQRPVEVRTEGLPLLRAKL